jgi:hypothetical protein
MCSYPRFEANYALARELLASLSVSANAFETLSMSPRSVSTTLTPMCLFNKMIVSAWDNQVRRRTGAPDAEVLVCERTTESTKSRRRPYHSQQTFDGRMDTTGDHDILLQKTGYDVACDNPLGKVELFARDNGWAFTGQKRWRNRLTAVMPLAETSSLRGTFLNPRPSANFLKRLLASLCAWNRPLRDTGP